MAGAEPSCILSPLILSQSKDEFSDGGMVRQAHHERVLFLARILPVSGADFAHSLGVMAGGNGQEIRAWPSTKGRRAWPSRTFTVTVAPTGYSSVWERRQRTTSPEARATRYR